MKLEEQQMNIWVKVYADAISTGENTTKARRLADISLYHFNTTKWNMSDSSDIRNETNV